MPAITESKISHADLLSFAEARVNLRRDDVEEERAQVNRLKERLAQYIKEHPDFDLVKMLNSGSLAKGTALKTINDVDVAVYLKKSAAPTGSSLIIWLEGLLRKAYSNLKSEQFVVKQHCVTLTFRGTGLDVDLVPVLYEGDPEDYGFLVTQDNGDQVLTSIPKHLTFIRKRKDAFPDFRQLVRLVKWWARQQKMADSTFRCKSFMIELLLAHLFDAGLDGSDYLSALESIFAYIVRTELRDRIAFTDNYDLKALPKDDNAPIRIYDPVNPVNNIMALYTVRQRDALVAAAERTLDAIAYARYATTKAIAIEQWRIVLGPSFGA